MGFAETIPVFSKVLRSLIRVNDNPVKLFGLTFPNCVGLAAGLDKNGMFARISSALGFGHVEVGTVTPEAQAGNSLPRLFRYPNQVALVNRMGFNNLGAKAIVARLQKYYPKDTRISPVGVNIGKGKNTAPEKALDDYVSAFRCVAPQADYVTINISSPNTPGLRLLHNKNFLEPLLHGIKQTRLSVSKNHFKKSTPCLLKISPDEDFKNLEAIIGLAIEYDFDGIIATNTTIQRDFADEFNEAGGLSGKPLEDMSLEVIKFIAKETKQKLPVIGVGGILDTESAHKKLDAGASLLQIYTGYVYNGPLFPSRLVNSLNTRFNWP